MKIPVTRTVEKGSGEPGLCAQGSQHTKLRQRISLGLRQYCHWWSVPLSAQAQWCPLPLISFHSLLSMFPSPLPLPPPLHLSLSFFSLPLPLSPSHVFPHLFEITHSFVSDDWTKGNPCQANAAPPSCISQPFKNSYYFFYFESRSH